MKSWRRIRNMKKKIKKRRHKVMRIKILMKKRRQRMKMTILPLLQSLSPKSRATKTQMIKRKEIERLWKVWRHLSPKSLPRLMMTHQLRKKRH